MDVVETEAETEATVAREEATTAGNAEQPLLVAARPERTRATLAAEVVVVVAVAAGNGHGDKHHHPSLLKVVAGVVAAGVVAEVLHSLMVLWHHLSSQTMDGDHKRTLLHWL